MENRRPRVLFLSPCRPDRQGSGWEQRSYSLVKAYAEVADVELWYSDGRPGTTVAPQIPGLVSEHYYDVRDFESTGRRLDGVVVRAVEHDLPFVRWTIDAASRLGWSYSRARERLRDTIHDFDLVHVFHLPGSHVPWLCDRGVPLVWDVDEVPSPLRRALEVGFEHGVAGLRQRSMLRRFELQVRRSDRVFVSTPLEKRLLCRHGNVECVANVVQEPPAHRNEWSVGKEFLFVGNFSFPPNQDAVEFLLNQVWPQIVELVPDSRLTLVGWRPTTDWMPPLPEGVEVIYDAASIEPFYERATVCLAPIRFGGGSKIKIIEAFARGVPVVATTAAAVGLEVSGGVHIALADTPRGLAEAATDLLRDTRRAAALARAARAHYLSHHSQDAVDVAVARTVQELLS